MKKCFNTTGDCKQQIHYMVDISDRLEQIRTMVDAGMYFTINRARQYGKTTMLRSLEKFLEDDYVVVSLDFQTLSYADFEKEELFAEAFSREILDVCEMRSDIPAEVRKELEGFAASTVRRGTLSVLFRCLSKWCRQSERGIILMIDEVDSASNNQVFLDFLAQLRGYYINRDRKPTFQSVILAGVYDVKNLKRKITADRESKMNSPWNIAADFLVEMNFSAKDIEGMLSDYERDYETGMDVSNMAQMIYDYTGGYPFLVSRLCKLIDEQVSGSEAFRDRDCAWTKDGLLEAISILLGEKNTLFDSMIEKLDTFPKLKTMIHSLLFQGQSIVYNLDDDVTGLALMFGFVKTNGGSVQIANRIFETGIKEILLEDKVLIEAVV